MPLLGEGGGGLPKGSGGMPLPPRKFEIYVKIYAIWRNLGAIFNLYS